MTRQAATRLLTAAGVASPAHDAAVLAKHAHGAGVNYAKLLARRAAREPLQHLVGGVGFRYVDVAVGPGVFVPRPETEVVAGRAIDAVTGMRTSRPEPIVVDLCAGSGAIALAVVDEVPNAQVYAVESDPLAFGWLRRNVAGTAVVACRQDAASALPELAGRVDVVVSNPPYLPDGMPVEPEVAEHDPPAALWGGPDGLSVIAVVVDSAAMLLRPGGVLALEHGEDQGAAVAALLAAGGWTDVIDHADLAGRPRCAVGRR